jgi:uncharacterized protein with FMN-binding domain
MTLFFVGMTYVKINHMKKYILSLSLIIAFTFYVLLESQNSIPVVSGSATNAQPGNNIINTPSSVTPATPVAAVPQPVHAESNSESDSESDSAASAPTPSTVPAPTPAPVTPATPAPTPIATGLYHDGSYTGDSVNVYYGNVQTQAVISGGKLMNVNILDYPHDRNTSARINSAALPKLVREAIASQNAQVDIVSGATETSQGFRQSLATALANAKG